MSQEGYADPVTNDGPRFHSIIPVSELTERVTRVRAIGTSDKTQPLQCEEPRMGQRTQLTSTPTKAQRGSGAQDTKSLGLRPRTRPLRLRSKNLGL